MYIIRRRIWHLKDEIPANQLLFLCQHRRRNPYRSSIGHSYEQTAENYYAHCLGWKFITMPSISHRDIFILFKSREMPWDEMAISQLLNWMSSVSQVIKWIPVGIWFSCNCSNPCTHAVEWGGKYFKLGFSGQSNLTEVFSPDKRWE